MTFAELHIQAPEFARQAAFRLNLGPIQLAWHDYAPDNKNWFAWVEFYTDLKYQAKTIHLAAKACVPLPPAELRWVIYHESRHIWQSLNSQYLHGRDAEKDASQWTTRELGYASEHLLDYWLY